MTKRVSRSLVAVVGMLGLFGLATGARAQEVEIPLNQVPKAVMDASPNPYAARRQRDFDVELSIVLELFERSGGRPALKMVLAHARRVEATPDGAHELLALEAWLPTACRMLETELMLIDLLSARASVAPR